jgi:His-Xaa-Ser system radical SAM maturase HxsC
MAGHARPTLRCLREDLGLAVPHGRRVSVLWKNSARHNGLLLTEQCDNYCLMCSQPPKDRDDAWLFDRARKVISLLPPGARALSLTGGEPTLHADALIGLLEHCKQVAPGLSLHLLTNGRRFADPEFTRRYAAVGLSDIMAGIPVYAPEPGLHDFIVQAPGAFNETVHGILNLASLGQAVQIRVVVQRHTVPVLAGLAAFIVRNLPFIAQVALMGLEMTGLARPNAPLVWADPADYQHELAQAVDILATARDHDADLQPPALRPRPAPLAVRGPLHQRLEERLPRHLPLLLGPQRMRRRLHHKRQPPQRAPAPGTLISQPGPT